MRNVRMITRIFAAAIITVIFVLAILPEKVHPFNGPQAERPYSPLRIVQNPNIPIQGYQDWESLTPEQKERLRQRWQYYRSLPPREQQLLRNRYEELKRLPPEEQRLIRERIKRWEELTPEEQEFIRRKFRGN